MALFYFNDKGEVIAFGEMNTSARLWNITCNHLHETYLKDMKIYTRVYNHTPIDEKDLDHHRKLLSTNVSNSSRILSANGASLENGTE